MLRILGKPTSINVRKVLWLCAELDLPYELEEWGSGFRATDTPEFRSLNPNGLVPVIRDGDFVLWESNAICRYLASRHGRVDFLPDEASKRAIVEQWMDWQATELNNSWRYAFMALVRRNPAYADSVAIDSGIQAWNRHMGILEMQLSRTGAYVTGSHFTLADIAIGLSVNRWYMTPIGHPDLPAIRAYSERLKQRPGYLLHGCNGTP
jgi:glutathione S-transferase